MDLCRSWGRVGVGTSVGWRSPWHLHPGAAPLCSSLGGSKGARLGACWEGACTGRPPSWAEGRTEPADWASCAPEPIHLPTQLHRAACSQSRARPRAPGSLGVRRPWLRSQLGPLRAARSREATLLHRAHPFIVQNKWKQNDVHIHARGLGSGVRWAWNTRVCPCPPPPSVRSPPPSRRPPPARVGGVGRRRVRSAQTATPFCSAAAGQVHTDVGLRPRTLPSCWRPPLPGRRPDSSWPSRLLEVHPSLLLASQPPPPQPLREHTSVGRVPCPRPRLR